MTAPHNHATLKELARSLNRPIESIYPLAMHNDPFVADMPARRTGAEWFGRLWTQLQIRPGIHDRRIHYMLVSQETKILYPDGTPYENTEQDWIYLAKAARDARYLSLIPPGAIVDHRNPEPEIYIVDESATAAAISSSSGGFARSTINFVAPFLFRPRLQTARPTIPQPYHIEIWAEKSTVNDVLMPLGQQYGVNIVTGSGELSATRCEELVERARRGGKPVRILYVSDFDPAGASMPVAVARKIEFYIAQTGSVDLDVQVRPVVLTHEQCVQYRLPRTPIKETERRAGAFEARFGEGATELDALEALRSGELRRILIREIRRYHDGTLDARIAQVTREVEADLGAIQSEVYERHAEALAELEAEAEAIAAEAEAARQGIEARERDFQARIRPILDVIAHELSEEAPDVDDYDWPEPKDADEDDDPLFDSTRDYIEQLERYREYQGKEANPTLYNRGKFTGTCVICAREFTASRPAKMCSSACRARAFRRNGRG